MQLALERSDVAPAKPPLSTLLERRKNVLACEFVDGVRTEVQESRDFLAVQKNIVFLDHPSIPATNLIYEPGSGRAPIVNRDFLTPRITSVKKLSERLKVILNYSFWRMNLADP
jgi:hypothetical protein